MKFEIDPKRLHAAVAATAPAVDKKDRFHSLTYEGVRIVADDDGRVTLHTNNGNIWITHSILVEDSTGGEVVVSHDALKRFTAAMRSREDKIILGTEGDHLRLTVGEVSVRLASLTANGRTMAPVVEAAGQPVDLSLHLGALVEVSKFVSTDDNRPILCNVHYKNGAIAATDSYRLALVTVPEGAVDIEFMFNARAIKAVHKGLGALKSVEVTVDDARVLIDCGDTTVGARRSEGQFPNYSSIVPSSSSASSKTKVTKEARERTALMGRLAEMFHTDKWGMATPVVFEPTDKPGISLMTLTNGDNLVTIEVPLDLGGTRVAFNPKYLAEFFAGTNAGTVFGQDSLKPWGVEEEAEYCVGSRRTRVIMPVRVD